MRFAVGVWATLLLEAGFHLRRLWCPKNAERIHFEVLDLGGTSHLVCELPSFLGSLTTSASEINLKNTYSILFIIVLNTYRTV